MANRMIGNLGHRAADHRSSSESQTSQIAELLNRLQQANGSNRELDEMIERVFDSADEASKATSPPAYTGSAALSFALVRRQLPDWSLHLGYGVRGIFPYAALSRPGNERFEASAPTVPLAVLRVLMKTLAARATGDGR